MPGCCCCSGGSGGKAKAALPLICMVPHDGAAAKSAGGGGGGGGGPKSGGGGPGEDFEFLDEDYLRKHFKLPPRALYLDPFRRPLITFPISGQSDKNFNLAKKTKINQMILDGFLDPSEAITAPSVFPYATANDRKNKTSQDEEEIIYILQLPDWEFKCPVHNQSIRTPRFIWHSCKKKSKSEGGEMKQGGGPLAKPKPWLLSRHTDFDLMSQW